MRISPLRFSARLLTEPLEEPALQRISDAAMRPENDAFLKTASDDWALHFKCPRWMPGAVSRAEISVPKAVQLDGYPKQPPSIVTIKRGLIEDLENFAKRVFVQARTLHHTMSQPPACEQPPQQTPPQPQPRRRRTIPFLDWP